MYLKMPYSYLIFCICVGAILPPVSLNIKYSVLLPEIGYQNQKTVLLKKQVFLCGGTL